MQYRRDDVGVGVELLPSGIVHSITQSKKCKEQKEIDSSAITLARLITTMLFITQIALLKHYSTHAWRDKLQNYHFT